MDKNLTDMTDMGLALKDAGIEVQAPKPSELVPVRSASQRRADEEAEWGRRMEALTRQPLELDAFEYLNAPIPGAHHRFLYVPFSWWVTYAQAVGRQITLKEVNFFVGLDGELQSGVCSKLLSEERTSEQEIALIERSLLQKKADIDALDPTLFASELKQEKFDRLAGEVQKKINQIREEVRRVPTRVRFTPMFWVDPRLNPRLVEELRANGGDVARAFMAGDLELDIIRSGCFYKVGDALHGFSGSPWYYDRQTKETNLSLSPLGQMAFRHPEAKNDPADIDSFLTKQGRGSRLKYVWGSSQKEFERQRKLAEREQAPNPDSPNPVGRGRDFIGDLFRGMKNR